MPPKPARQAAAPVMAQGQRGLSHSGMDRPPPAVEHPPHAARAYNGLNRERTKVFVPAEADVQGIGSFLCCPGTLRIHNQPKENPLCITDIGKVSKNLCLESLLGF